MATLKQGIKHMDFSSGLIDDQSVSDSLLPVNAVRKAINVVFDDPVGSVAQRKGITIIGNQISASKNVIGLYNFRDSGSGVNHQLIAVVNGTIYKLVGATWTGITSGLSATAKMRFVTFLDEVIALNGSDAPRRWDGGAGAFATSGGNCDIANFPTTKAAITFNSKIYAIGNPNHPSRLYNSSTASSAGTISWTSGNDATDINPDDGDGDLTSIATNGTVIMLFKERSMYRWNGAGGDPNRVVNVGTTSHESVQSVGKGLVYFFGQTSGAVGVYRTDGGQPVIISKGIKKWINAISSSNYANIAASYDDDHYYLSVGDVTVDGTTYNNCSYVFTFSSNAWTVFSHPSEFKVHAPYINGTAATIVVGDDNGQIFTLNSGTDDNGTAIASECEFAPDTFGDRGKEKMINEMMVYSKQYTGLQFLMKADSGNFLVLDSIKSTEQRIGGLPVLQGRRMFPKIIASNSQTRWIFDGFEYTNVNVTEGYGD